VYLQSSGDDIATILFAMVRDSPSIQHLPEIFQQLAFFMRRDFSEWLLEKFHPPIDGKHKENKYLSRIKRIYSLVPQKLMMAVLKITHPAALTKGITSLFVARPFGAKNLMQRCMESMLRVSETETEIRQLKKLLASRHRKVAKKIKNYFKKKEKETSFLSQLVMVNDIAKAKDLGQDNRLTDEQLSSIQTLIYSILYNQSIQPILHPHHQAPLSYDDIVIIWKWFNLEGRRLAKIKFVELIGSDMVINVIKEVVPLLYLPWMSLFETSDLESLAKGVFDAMHGAIQVGSHHHDYHRTHQHHVVEEVRQGYGQVFDGFAKIMYEFGRKIVCVDAQRALHGEGKLEALVSWALKLYVFNKKGNIDVSALLNDLPAHQRDQVMRELSTEINRRMEKKQLKAEIRQHTVIDDKQDQSAPLDQTTIDSLEKQLKGLAMAPPLVWIPLLSGGFCERLKARCELAAI
jgi:hypothetical protein